LPAILNISRNAKIKPPAYQTVAAMLEKIL